MVKKNEFTPKERKLFQEEINKIFFSDEIRAYYFEVLNSSDEKTAKKNTLEYLFSKTSFSDNIRIVGTDKKWLHGLSFRKYSNGDDYRYIDVEFYFKSRKYNLKSGYYREKKLRLTRKSSEEELLAKRKKKYSDYAIIEHRGEKALVRFLAGDHKALTSKYIKQDIVNGMDDDAIILLYKLKNGDIK